MWVAGAQRPCIISVNAQKFCQNADKRKITICWALNIPGNVQQLQYSQYHPSPANKVAMLLFVFKPWNNATRCTCSTAQCCTLCLSCAYLRAARAIMYISMAGVDPRLLTSRATSRPSAMSLAPSCWMVSTHCMPCTYTRQQ